MFNHRKRRSAKRSSGDAGSVLLAENGPTELENRVQDDAPIEEQIRTRAYHLYLERDARPDGDVRDWLRAEREFRTHS